MDDTGNALVIDTSDAICADYIIERVGHGQDNSVVVVDYLQLLDQRRRNPELAVQVKTLAGFARTEEHTSELQSLMLILYAVFCLKKKIPTQHHITSSYSNYT